MNVAELEAKLAQHDAAYRAVSNHRAAKAQHERGKPRAPAGERPTEPQEARPAVTEVLAAREAVRAAERAQGAAEQAGKALAEAKTAEASSRAKSEAATEEARRVGRLPAIVRRAPGLLLERQLGALPASPFARVTATEDGTLTVEGLSAEGAWVDAAKLSDGERVRAGAALQAAVRAAAAQNAGAAWGRVPVMVDNRQAWTGELQVAAPAVVLVSKRESS